MRAAQFNYEFGEFIGMKADTLAVYNRGLAEAGLRAKASGSRLPDVTTQEAVYLLLAILSGKPATRAADIAADLGKFHVMVGQQDALLIVARALDMEPTVLAGCSLVEAVSKLCRRLALNPHAFDVVELAVDQACLATLSIEANGEAAELVFNGVTDADSRRGLRTINIAEKRVLAGIGKATAAARWEADADE